jgi:CHC2 zinc finger
MARIPDDELARLKAEVSLPDLVSGAGVVLGREGRDLVGACPFHDDGERPGLVVSKSGNSWRCMAGCGGSVVDWVMAAEGVSFRHAVELLRDGFRPARLDQPARHRSTARRIDGGLDPGLGDGELLDAVAGFYHERLMASSDALGWLENRRLLHPEALTSFGLGLGDRSLSYCLPSRDSAAGAELRARLQGLGIYRPSGHEHLNGAVVVPIRDSQGAVVEMFGRRMAKPDARFPRRSDLFLRDEPRGVFNLAAFEAGDEAIVCAGVVDALTMWVAGLRNVTATYRPDRLHPDLVHAIDAYGIGRVVLAFPAADDGGAGVEAIAAGLATGGVECFAMRLFDDVNAIARGSDDAAGVLGDLVRAAEPIGDHTTFAASRPDITAAPEPVVSQLEDTGPADGNETPADAHDGEEIAAASPVPPAPTAGLDVRVDGDEVRVVLGRRRWRLRGLGRNSSFDALRANVLVALGDVFHVDTLDLYSARARGVFIAQAATELGMEESVVKRDLGKVLLAAESHVEALIGESLEAEQAPAVVLDAQERAAAMGLLCDPGLVDRIRADFAAAGVVGESTNLLVGYLAATSRLLDRPLAVIVQSTSAAGKSQLMDAVLSFVPAEDQVRYSAMTGQSLYYLGEGDLAHKILAVAEEEGAERAAYALKLLQSEGEVSIASTGKDTASGRLVTHDYRVSGPTAIFLTTTAIDVDEELLNRCLVLSVDEDRAQTRAIHASQREAHTLDGLLAKRRRGGVIKLHQDAQRLLEPVVVVNPFAGRLGFADTATRTRRDHVKYLTLISAIALLHQHQRPKQTAVVDGEEIVFIEATVDDIALANDLAHEVLGRSLDELPPQTRRLLGIVADLVSDICDTQTLEWADVRFSRRDVRGWCGWSDYQVRTHLGRLVDLEYVLVHRGRRGQSFEYELTWQPPPEQADAALRRFPGLIDATELESSRGLERSSRGPAGKFEPPTSPHRGGIEGRFADPETLPLPGLSLLEDPEDPETTTEADGDEGACGVVVDGVVRLGAG